MQNIKSTFKASVILGIIASAACTQQSTKSGAISAETIAKLDQHFTTGSKKPIKLIVESGALNPVSANDANKVYRIEQMFRFVCGSYDFINESVSEGVKAVRDTRAGLQRTNQHTVNSLICLFFLQYSLIISSALSKATYRHLAHFPLIPHQNFVNRIAP